MARLQGSQESLGIDKMTKQLSIWSFFSKKKGCKKSKCSKWKGGHCKCGRG
ncbi:hypothetical protein SynROS8604_02076 [Synechococcus sp. ROS8604]|nr:hypothetical protein SynROS8604_02076 [Synechococcus sp. ROS8604]